MKKLMILLLVLMLLCGCTSTQTGTTDSICSHIDADNNGSCDSCSQSVLVFVDLYAINDLHGKLADGDSHVGVDELTTYLKTMGSYQNTVLISAGDMWQGSAESNQTKGQIITDWMNALDFAAMTLGNHEYDWGEDPILANDTAAEFPFLAINIYDRATNQRVEYCDASVVVDISGVQIGIIGAMGDCYSSISADKTEDIYFLTGKDLTQLVMEESSRLQAEGVEFIVYVLHDGLGSSNTGDTVQGSALKSYYDTALSNGYVDVVFEAHTHQRYLFTDEYGVYHLQNRGDNTGGISHVRLQINSVTGTSAVTKAELVGTRTYSSMADDPIVEQLLEHYADVISPALEIVGTNKQHRSSDYLCELAAQLYYQLGVAQWGETYDITLGGGFLATRSPYDLPAGEVAYSDLQSLFPFDNDIVLCSISGRDLINRFLESSHSKYHIYGNWGEIDPNATYYVVVDSYTAVYAPNRLTVVEEYTPGIYARDLLADYIAAGGLA